MSPLGLSIGKDLLEDLLQSLAVRRIAVGERFALEKPLVGGQLDVDQVGHGDDVVPSSTKKRARNVQRIGRSGSNRGAHMTPGDR